MCYQGKEHNRGREFEKANAKIETKYETDINKDYQDYLEGNSNLALNEVYQLGFRIAEREKHEKIFCVDWMEQGVSTRSIGEVYQVGDDLARPHQRQ